MASRYLVAGAGGTKNWSDTSIWSATSGGSTGETAPTSSDAVIMDAASLSGSLVLTLDANSACASLDSSALDNICTITGSVYTLSIYGNLTEHATNSRYNFTGTSYFYYKGTGTITTNGNTYHTWNRLYIDGVGITVTNGDDCNFAGLPVRLVNGTYDTNGKTITLSDFITVGTATKTLTLGSSLFVINAFNNSGSTGFTFNYDTSTVRLIGITNISSTISGVNTFYNFELIGSSNIGSSASVFASQTVDNNLTITGVNATNYRVLVQSSTIGTARTITCNGTTNITNCDFQDITLAGTANRDFSSQTDIGDCGGNSGITFPAAVTAYRVGVGNVSDATKWRTASGGATQSRVPLPQDSAVIDENTGTGTLTMDCPRIGSIDMSAQNQAMTWALANAMSCYGHYVLGSNVTPSGNFILDLRGRSSYNLNTYGKTIYRIGVYAPNGIYTNLSNTVFTLYIQFFYGTFDHNDYNHTASTCLDVELPSAIVYLGNGVLTSTTITGFHLYTTSGATLYSEGSTILLNPASGTADLTFGGGGKTYNIVRFSGSHTGNFIITGNNTFNELQIDAGRKVQGTAGSTQTIAPTGRLVSEGTAANHASLDSTTATPFNLVYAGTGYHQTHFLDVKSCNATANRFYSRGGVDGGGNTGWLFKSYLKWPQIINIS
jgi:hypothetical protein